MLTLSLKKCNLSILFFLFFWLGSIVVNLPYKMNKWVSEVRTLAPAYNNALSYQLSYVHRTLSFSLLPRLFIILFYTFDSFK